MDIDGFLDTVDGSVSKGSTSKNASTPEEIIVEDEHNWDEQIKRLSSTITTHINSGKYSSAYNDYVKLKMMSSEVLHHNLDIQEKINGAIKQSKHLLEMAYEDMKRLVDKKMRTIDQLLRLMNEEISNKDLKTAISLYKKIQVEYSQIPTEFSAEKSQIQNLIITQYVRMKRVYEELLAQRETQLRLDFNTILQSAQTALNNNQIEIVDTYIQALEKISSKFPTRSSQKNADVFHTLAEFKKIVLAYKHEKVYPKKHLVLESVLVHNELSSEPSIQPSPQLKETENVPVSERFERMNSSLNQKKLEPSNVSTPSSSSVASSVTPRVSAPSSSSVASSVTPRVSAPSSSSVGSSSSIHQLKSSLHETPSQSQTTSSHISRPYQSLADKKSQVPPPVPQSSSQISHQAAVDSAGDDLVELRKKLEQYKRALQNG